MTTRLNGFLVVLKEPEQRGDQGRRRNPNYSGIGRVPAFPSAYEEESEPLFDYVCGEIKSTETNLIPDFGTAVELWRRLSRSARKFEVIVCCHSPDDVPDGMSSDACVPLGYDVASVSADYWSIVDDFSPNEWADDHLKRLNEYGLFSMVSDAHCYLEEYRAHDEPDRDAPLEVVYLIRITDSYVLGRS